MIIRLQTNDGTWYMIAQLQTKWVLRTDNLTVTDSSLSNVLHTLGGMVQWDAWAESSRAMLAHLNAGKAI